MLARDIMMHDVLTVPESATLLDAAKIMINARVSGLPVTNAAGKMVGVLSEVDVMRQIMGSDIRSLAADRDAPAKVLAATIDGVMRRRVLAVEEDADIEAAASLMLQHNVKRIPVVRNGEVVGVVSRLDLVKAMLARTGAAVPAAATAPATAPAAGAGAPPPPAATVDDETLRREVTMAIRRLDVVVRGGFDVIVQKGVAHLWGEVSDEAEYRACRSAAARVPGIGDVFSHMQVHQPRRRPGPYRHT